jgi:arsenate reductase (glutaredoxin)
MALEMYGIRNCDTVKKARAWLASHGIDCTFHDYKAEGADPALLRAWCAAQGWESILNRSGTTFRKLDPKETADLDADKAVALMLAHPSAIKRPIVTGGKRLLVGFKPETYAAELG